ncbi:tRNA (guanosine(46)-N7)-methyltransferase TrmB [Pediococcus acidilactici]|uniref:tRNA (guanosine(46)-N7)-methyltransferase TrmB n=1 Tax=Pediococcus acidilactici TaxID=1254 RepID=UPI00132A6407|nr:tRNA (guanosine(46)-N7)-methyltransferase TrmB [Pediococcus acidilactici]KAF0336048.1 tRNA (guanosine(46)-N7)-methyltransferase TrmB [Pediococcus acidilactici]KAF0345583.1 tRNA (guanosine(46)-N7)-methyltransferase TrmB [Pediococcus acidilactici]KAF0354690.1 tRNA (guanosine(46)-N7)-methyltransferase TrmB [Pediococcus acidilactici]KAF0358922.1 tRNA (guanosine(46)-N7)-methyltransferase TrmB [Pediococcus acidilactici]KAF0364082.1 tRNA (guanosine(46)-N7)-methyltransferase TrmB [Pediococcus acidi
MRVRNKPWAPKLIAEHPEMVVENGQAYKGKWHKRFAKQQPLWIEVGTGKGQFIINMAKKYPQYNFIGIEIQKTVVAIALKNALAEELPNLQFLHADGAELTDYFADGEVDQLFLNFSDPWPKTRHEKRRLTYKSFLKVYEQILVEHGKLEFKTDNQGLFEYSLTSLNNYGMIFEGVWLDLHNSPENEDNVETEYEHKFSEKGQPIYKLVAHF